MSTRMNAHMRTYRYIGDAAANMHDGDIIVKRDDRYLIGMHNAQNGDWYLIEESQPQFPMFRKCDDLSIHGAKKVLKRDNFYYYAMSTLCKNYSYTLKHISKLQDAIELQCVVWLDRRWRLFPVWKVDPPPAYVQNDMGRLAEWFARDTTSLICLQPRLVSTDVHSTKKATWLNLNTWAYADVRRLILSHLSLGDMILVEAAHGLTDKLACCELEEHICANGYVDLAVWYVCMRDCIPRNDRLVNLLTECTVTPALIKLEGFDYLLRHAITRNQRDFIIDVSTHVPLCNYVGCMSFAWGACKYGWYDLMFELLLPNESCDDIWDHLARSSDRNKALAACIQLHAIIPMKWHQRNPFIRATGGYQPMIDWAVSLFNTQT